MEAEEFDAKTLARRLSETRIEEAEGAEDAVSLKARFRKTMFYRDVDLRPNFEFGYWEETLRQWHQQGLPEEVGDEEAAYRYFGIENWAMVPVNAGPTPVCEEEVLEENEDHKVYRDSMGCVAEINKKGNKSIPHFLEFPIKDRESWLPIKDALNPDDPRRYEHLEEALPKLARSTAPVGIAGGSLAGTARNLIGFEHYAILPYEDPELFRDIVDTFGHCITTVLERVLPLIEADFCMGWEDICFNQGPIISPEVYREYIGPWYRRISDLLVSHGCCVYSTDCDGDVTPLVDVFLDHGMNTLFPVEVHAGTDPVALRERYGRRLKLWGGFDKMVLLRDRAAIDAELERLRPAVEEGAFICGVDHRVQADVPLDNYKHYLERKRELLKVGGEPQY